MSRIQNCFEALRSQNRKALIPFVTAGDPRPDVTVPLLHAMVSAGADLLELGVPFSDPMADGVTIQRASHIAGPGNLACDCRRATLGAGQSGQANFDRAVGAWRQGHADADERDQSRRISAETFITRRSQSDPPRKNQRRVKRRQRSRKSRARALHHSRLSR